MSMGTARDRLSDLLTFCLETFASDEMFMRIWRLTDRCAGLCMEYVVGQLILGFVIVNSFSAELCLNS